MHIENGKEADTIRGIPATAEASFDIVMNSIGFKVVQNTRCSEPCVAFVMKKQNLLSDTALDDHSAYACVLHEGSIVKDSGYF